MDAKRLGPALRGGALGTILLAAVAVVAVVGLVGRQPAGAPPSQDSGAPASIAPAVPSAAASAAPSVLASPPKPSAPQLGYGLDGSGWFQLEAPDDGTGAVTRYVLTAGTLGRAGSFTVDLPNPAFASGPYGEQILYGGDDDTRSEIGVLSLVDGTRRVLLTSDQPVWRATLDRDAANLYYVLLDRATREELGIWRLRLDGLSKSELVMAPPAWNADLQPITATEFVWGPNGDVLAVYTCGLGVGCRTRVLDVGTGKVRSYDEVPPLGDIIGLTADSYITYGICGGTPCPLYRVNLATGAVETLVDGAGGGYAVLVQVATGPLLVYEAPFVPDYRLLGLDLTTGATRQVYSGPTEGPTLVSSLQTQYRDVGLPADWLLLGPRGELLPLPGAPGAPLALRVGDDVQVSLTGVSR